MLDNWTYKMPTHLNENSRKLNSAHKHKHISRAQKSTHLSCIETLKTQCKQNAYMAKLLWSTSAVTNRIHELNHHVKMGIYETKITRKKTVHFDLVIFRFHFTMEHKEKTRR